MAKKSLEEKITEAEVRLEKRRKLYEESKKEVEDLKKKKAEADNAKIMDAVKKTDKQLDEILAFLGAYEGPELPAEDAAGQETTEVADENSESENSEGDEDGME